MIVITTTNMWAAVDIGIRSRPERIGEHLPIGNPCLDDLVNENGRETWADNTKRMDSLMDVFLRRFPYILRTKLKQEAIESTFKEAFSRICSGAGIDGRRPIGLSCDEIQDVFKTVERQIILKKPDPEAGDVLKWANARIGELQARRLMDGTRSASAHAPETY